MYVACNSSINGMRKHFLIPQKTFIIYAYIAKFKHLEHPGLTGSCIGVSTEVPASKG